MKLHFNELSMVCESENILTFASMLIVQQLSINTNTCIAIGTFFFKFSHYQQVNMNIILFWPFF